MSGPRPDVQLICDACMKPASQYSDTPPAQFVGRSVKIAFGSKKTCIENMWVKVTGVEGKHFVGWLKSQPVILRHVKPGDRIKRKPAQIIDVEPPLGECAAINSAALLNL